PFNIRVSLIEVGFLRTPMANHRQTATSQIAEYDPWRQRALDAVRASERKAPGPELVAETVLRIAKTKTPRLRYVIRQQAQFTTRLRRFLRDSAYAVGVGRTSRLDHG